MKSLVLLLLLGSSACALPWKPDAFDHPYMVCWPAKDKPLLFCAPVKDVTR